MPTTAKTSGSLAKLGDLSTFTASSSAIPFDTSDSSGSIPTFGATFVGGAEREYHVGETLTIASPSIGNYSGEIVSYSQSANSDRYTLDTHSIMARLNSDIRAYPLSDYSTVKSTLIPLYAIEYWTQQCGLFFTKVTGDVLFYQSQYGHFGAFAKDIVRPLRSKRWTPESGGSTGAMHIVDGRVWTGFGHGFGPTVDFPEKDTRPVRIPLPSETSRATFGVDVRLNGTGQTSHVSWQLSDPNGKTVEVRILAESDSGFKLQVAETPGNFVTRLTQTAPRDRRYSVYVSLSSATATTTRFEMTVFDFKGVSLGAQTTTATSNLRGSLSLYSVRYQGYMGGAGTEMSYANVFVSIEKAHPAKRFEDAKVLTRGYKGAAYLIGFDGNTWDHIKQYCSIYHLDVSYRDGQLHVGPRQKDVAVGASLSERSTTIRARDQARNVEVVNYNHTPTGVSPAVLWAADSVYQVAVGEVQEFLVQTEHSILDTTQPICVNGIDPYPYKVGVGQYVVTGSDGYIVSPQFWEDQGGSILTETTENDGEIKITIKGPDYDSPRAPYRISEGDAGRPALYVCGTGVLSKPETMKVSTGNGRAAKDIGVKVESPFIGSAQLAYDAAVRAGRSYAVPEVTVSITEPLGFDEVSKLGTYPAGVLVKQNGNILRVTDASQTPNSVSGSASQHNTIYQFNRSHGTGATIADFKAANAGRTIGQFNIKPMKVVK